MLQVPVKDRERDREKEKDRDRDEKGTIISPLKKLVPHSPPGNRQTSQTQAQTQTQQNSHQINDHQNQKNDHTHIQSADPYSDTKPLHGGVLVVPVDQRIEAWHATQGTIYYTVLYCAILY